jgi:hypothetical protein
LSGLTPPITVTATATNLPIENAVPGWKSIEEFLEIADFPGKKGVFGGDAFIAPLLRVDRPARFLVKRQVGCLRNAQRDRLGV